MAGPPPPLPITLQNVLAISHGFHTLQNAADHFNVTIPELVREFIVRAIFHLNIPGFGTIRTAGYAGRRINIILQQRNDRYRMLFSIPESNTLIDLLNLVEYSLNIQRGTYELTYTRHMRVAPAVLNTLLQWDRACDYYFRMYESVGFIALKLNIEIPNPNSDRFGDAQDVADALQNEVNAQGGNQV